MIESVSTKKCTKCGIEKLHTKEYFNIESNNKSGLNSKCRECKNKQNNEYKKRNKDKIRIGFQIYKKNNRHRFNIHDQRRRARKKQLPSTLTYDEWMDTLDRFDHSCAYCSVRGDQQQEHFVPVSAGGGYTQMNIIPACRECNGSKNDKYFEDWYTEVSDASADRIAKIITHFNMSDDDEAINIRR